MPDLQHFCWLQQSCYGAVLSQLALDMQVLARLLKAETALRFHSRNQQLGLAASSQVLWHDGAEQPRSFGTLINAATSPVQSGTAAVMRPDAHSARLPGASWHGLHGMPPAAASEDNAGQYRDKHEHDSHQLSAKATDPAVATVGQSMFPRVHITGRTCGSARPYEHSFTAAAFLTDNTSAHGCICV